MNTLQSNSMSSTPSSENPVYSIIIPLYQAEIYVPALLAAMESLRSRLNGTLEIVFVVDGATDNTLSMLEATLPSASFQSVLATHSRNYGSLAAIRTGLARANGQFFATLSADLQEPPELLLNIFESLSANQADLVLGQRLLRDDPLVTRWMSDLFWVFYRRFIQADIPPRGFDVFGCNQAFRTRFLELNESHNVLVGTLLWVGFRRKVVPYNRRPNHSGRSTWSLLRKLNYAADNVFLYSDFPVKAVILLGGVAMGMSLIGGVCLYWGRAPHSPLLKYASEILIALFFSGANAVGLGILGSYLWRVLVSTRRWPQAVVMDVRKFSAIR